jgi:hypothetical protein
MSGGGICCDYRAFAALARGIHPTRPGLRRATLPIKGRQKESGRLKTPLPCLLHEKIAEDADAFGAF